MCIFGHAHADAGLKRHDEKQVNDRIDEALVKEKQHQLDKVVTILLLGKCNQCC